MPNSSSRKKRSPHSIRADWPDLFVYFPHQSGPNRQRPRRTRACAPDTASKRLEINEHLPARRIASRQPCVPASTRWAGGRDSLSVNPCFSAGEISRRCDRLRTSRAIDSYFGGRGAGVLRTSSGPGSIPSPAGASCLQASPSGMTFHRATGPSS